MRLTTECQVRNRFPILFHIQSLTTPTITVMFRIVEDPMPPIPESCSPLMEDFLKQCFKKNPLERPSAETLFEHPWLKMTWGEHRVQLEIRL
jgi:serine/threonine protein kinase